MCFRASGLCGCSAAVLFKSDPEDLVDDVWSVEQAEEERKAKEDEERKKREEERKARGDEDEDDDEDDIEDYEGEDDDYMESLKDEL